VEGQVAGPTAMENAMVKRTKKQAELVRVMSDAIDLRREIAKRIEELMTDEDFPNNPSWIARCLVNEYNIERR